MNSRFNRPPPRRHRQPPPKTPCQSPPTTPPLIAISSPELPDIPPPAYTPLTPLSRPPVYTDIPLTPLASGSPSALSTLTSSTPIPTPISTTPLSNASLDVSDETTTSRYEVDTRPTMVHLSRWEMFLRVLYRWRWRIFVIVLVAVVIGSMIWWIVSSSVWITESRNQY